VDAVEAARRWASEWERAWREHDAVAVGRLYADGAEFRPHALGDPRDPEEYARWAFGLEEGGGDIRFGEPLPIGDDRAAVEYWAVVRQGRGDTTIAGVSILRFDDRGLVVEERDYFNEDDIAHAPHASWGR
jgi:hypothetical protein